MVDKDKLKALELAVGQIEKQFGKGSIMRLDKDEVPANIAAISTGSLGLDVALGIGGVPRGRIIEVYGPESSGKTTLALNIIAQAQKTGGQAAFIDAEHALDVAYARKLGVKTDELLISQPDTGEQALEITETLVRSGAIDVIVVDSVAALTPRAEIEGEMGDAHMGLQARLMSQALRKLTGAISKSNTTARLHQPDPHEDRRHVRQPRDKTGAFAALAVDANRAAVRGHDLVNDGQTEARALADTLRGEKRCKKLLHDRFAHADARVLDGEPDLAAVKGSPDGQRAATRHRMNRIHRQVDQNLMQLPGVSRNLGKMIVQHPDQADPLPCAAGLEKVEALTHQMVQVAGSLARRELPGEEQQLLDHFTSVERRVYDFFDVMLRLNRQVGMVLGQLCESENAAERFVQLVRGPCGHLPDGCQAIRMMELLHEPALLFLGFRMLQQQAHLSGNFLKKTALLAGKRPLVHWRLFDRIRDFKAAMALSPHQDCCTQLPGAVMKSCGGERTGIHSDAGRGDLGIQPAEGQELNDIPKCVVDRAAGILDRLGDAVQTSQLIRPLAQQIVETAGRLTPVRRSPVLALGHRPLM